MLKMIVTAALLVSGASACNNMPGPQAASHPPAVDMTCEREPAALTEEQAAAANGSELEDTFNLVALLAGRDCRAALARVCGWHVERGMVLPVGIACRRAY